MDPVDPDSDPQHSDFQFDADPDPNPTTQVIHKFENLTFLESFIHSNFTLFYLSHKCQRYHNVQYFGQHTEIFRKKVLFVFPFS